MGYRSYVYVAIVPAAETDHQHVQPLMDQLKLLMATQFKFVSDEFEPSDWVVWDWSPGRLDIEIKDVKWYPSYLGVQAFHKFLDAIIELGYSYEFVRLGEDGDDTEQLSGGDLDDHLLDVVRNVERI